MAFIRQLLDNFKYYAEPEGKDPVNKIMGLSKYGLITGSFISIYDACLYSKCLNAFEFLNTSAYWVIPLTGMCVAFSTVTYTATNLRKKDDKYNYVLGALASGSVLHAWVRNPLYSGWGTTLFVIIALLKKDAVEMNKKNPSFNKNLLLFEECPPRWHFPWRNVYYRDYSGKPRFEHDKVDYYKHFQ